MDLFALRLTAQESALLQAHRRCNDRHREMILDFAEVTADPETWAEYEALGRHAGTEVQQAEVIALPRRKRSNRRQLAAPSQARAEVIQLRR